LSRCLSRSALRPAWPARSSIPHSHRCGTHPTGIDVSKSGRHTEFNARDLGFFGVWGSEKVALRAAWVGSVDFAVLPLYAINCGIVPFY